MRKIVILLMAMFAGLAGWGSPANAGVFSATGPVIAILADELFLGVAKGNLDGSGTIRIQSLTRPEVTCRGRFTSSAKLGGIGNLECSDNVTATIMFQRLSLRRGYGTGTLSRGAISFTYGLSANESEPYLKLPPGKALRQDGKNLVLEDIMQLAPPILAVKDSIPPLQEAAPSVLPALSP